MLSQLIDVISRTAALNERDIALCARAFQPVSFKKNTVVEAAGQVPQHVYFIAAGFMRLYYTDERGNEATTYFGAPNEFLTPFLSFIHQQQAPENLACITACEALRISRPAMAALIEASVAFKTFSVTIFEQAIAATGRRADSLATLNAEQRYRQLLAARPDLLLHVPVQHIASFLGIKPESLSRIRRQSIS